MGPKDKTRDVTGVDGVKVTAVEQIVTTGNHFGLDFQGEGTVWVSEEGWAA